MCAWNVSLSESEFVQLCAVWVSIELDYPTYSCYMFIENTARVVRVDLYSPCYIQPMIPFSHIGMALTHP